MSGQALEQNPSPNSEAGQTTRVVSGVWIPFSPQEVESKGKLGVLITSQPDDSIVRGYHLGINGEVLVYAGPYIRSGEAPPIGLAERKKFIPLHQVGTQGNLIQQEQPDGTTQITGLSFMTQPY